jgi:hypothetical protein
VAQQKRQSSESRDISSAKADVALFDEEVGEVEE